MKELIISLLLQKAHAQDLPTPFPAIPIPNWSGARTFPEIMSAIVDTLVIFAAVVAVIAIIIGGYQYITSAGNPEKAAQAKNTLLYAIIGLIVVMSAYIIIRFIANRIGA
jgi:hypothetical protein